MRYRVKNSIGLKSQIGSQFLEILDTEVDVKRELEKLLQRI
jgi:hypothetical protein